MTINRIRAAVAAAALIVPAAAVQAPTATAVGACGDDFVKLRSYEIYDEDSAAHIGNGYVQYSASQSRWCVTTYALVPAKVTKAWAKWASQTEWSSSDTGYDGFAMVMIAGSACMDAGADVVGTDYSNMYGYRTVHVCH